MNMDSSQSHHQNPNNNWLAFSLSNHHDADPKLEDFLGGGDSELKTVAASLFSGFSTSNWRWLLRRRSKITLRRRNRLITSANELPFTVALQGIDGQGDMKLIYGIIVAEEKGKVGKEDKFIWVDMIRKTKQPELMILQPSSTGVRPPPQTFRFATMRKSLKK